MLNVGQSYVNVGNWFTPKECDQIVNYAVNYGHYNNPVVGFGTGTAKTDKKTRDGRLFFFSHEAITKRILKHVRAVNEQYWNLDLYNVEPLQLTVYDVDDHYIWHRDQVHAGKHNPTHDKELIRKLSFSINMTQEGRDYRGGNLQTHDGIFHQEGDPHMDKKGNGVIFESQLAHRVLPVTQGRRIALVGWVSGPPYR